MRGKFRRHRLKVPFPAEDVDPRLTHSSLGSSQHPTRYHDRFSGFAGLTIVTDRQTDRHTTLLRL